MPSNFRIDYDPEALEPEFDDVDGLDTDTDNSEASFVANDQELAREHYLPVGKSRLRKPKGIPETLGLKYVGKTVLRDRIFDDDEEEFEGDSGEDNDNESTTHDRNIAPGGHTDHPLQFDGLENGQSGTDLEIDSDGALGSEDERFKDYTFRGSYATNVPSSGDGMEVDSESENEESLDESSENEDEEYPEDEDEDDEDEDEDNEDNTTSARQSQLRKLMAEERYTASAVASKVAHSDMEKGEAVRKQQKTFDSLLSTRIKLQKGLVAVNSLPALSTTHASTDSWKAAEGAALKLWDTIHDLRLDLNSKRTLSSQKRKHDDDSVDENTPIDTIWSKMQKLENGATPWREAILEKWSTKTQAVATISLGNKLNKANSASRPITAVIHETLLGNYDRLLARTRTPRSCAPLQFEKELDEEIYDDTDFYQQLLRALVDERSVDSGVAGAVQWTTAIRESKVKRKNLDAKKSKGRKLNYRVHEKLQNFMAPVPSTMWRKEQVDELFSGLLGHKIQVDEEDTEGVDERDVVPDDGLRIFGM